MEFKDWIAGAITVGFENVEEFLNVVVSHGGVVLFFFFNNNFNQIFLRAGNGDVCEVGFLLLHPWKSGKLGRHPGVATEEEDSGPFEAFRFVDGGEGDAGWGIGREWGEDGVDEDGKVGDGF